MGVNFIDEFEKAMEDGGVRWEELARERGASRLAVWALKRSGAAFDLAAECLDAVGCEMAIVPKRPQASEEDLIAEDAVGAGWQPGATVEGSGPSPSEDELDGRSAAGQATSEADARPRDAELCAFEDWLGGLGTFEPIEISGRGTDVVELPEEGMPFVIDVEKLGPHGLTVRMLDAEGKQLEILFSRTGHFRTTSSSIIRPGRCRAVSVESVDDWSATISPMACVRRAENRGVLVGEDVLRIDADGLESLRFSHDGKDLRYFKVWGVCEGETRRLVNVKGAFDDYVEWHHPHSLIVVRCDAADAWSVSW